MKNPSRRRRMIFAALIAQFLVSATAVADIGSDFIVTPTSATSSTPVQILVFSPYCGSPPGDSPYNHIQSMSSDVTGQTITIAISVDDFACFSAGGATTTLYVPFIFPRLSASVYAVKYSLTVVGTDIHTDYATTLNVLSTPPDLVPVEGMWWNPAESGSGYAIDVKHDVLVMTVFSYTDTGLPQWYLFFGPLINNAATGKLLKFANGQCISCDYRLPMAVGDDGMATVTFTSPSTATLLLPGGRMTQIVPQDF
jgi:hypothetical protein